MIFKVGIGERYGKGYPSDSILIYDSDSMILQLRGNMMDGWIRIESLIEYFGIKMTKGNYWVENPKSSNTAVSISKIDEFIKEIKKLASPEGLQKIEKFDFDGLKAAFDEYEEKYIKKEVEVAKKAYENTLGMAEEKKRAYERAKEKMDDFMNKKLKK